MQIVEVIDPMARQDRLDALLKKYHASRKNRVLVFVLYKKEASRIETFLERRGWKVCCTSLPLATLPVVSIPVALKRWSTNAILCQVSLGLV